MQFPTHPKLIALLPFTAFLVHHIDDFRPQVVVFLFAPEHTDFVAQIAERLAGRQMRFIQVSRQGLIKRTSIRDNALLLSFIGECHHSNQWIRFESVVRTFLIILRDSNSTGGRFQNMRLVNNPYICITWRNIPPIDPNHEILQVDFLRSSLWSIFTDRLTTLQGYVDRFMARSVDQSMCCVDDYQTDRMGTQHSKDGSSVVLITTGFRMGIYKLLGGLLHADYVRYCPLVRIRKTNKKSGGASMVVRDERLTGEFHNTWDEKINMVSLNPHTNIFPYQFPNGALRTRYRVVVPRIVVDSATNRGRAIWTKTLVVLGLMLSTGFFVVLRFVCRRLVEDRPLDGISAWWVSALFDTWARTLSVGAGQWMGRSRAERQMLTVIAVFAFLAGRIFAGVLYEQLLVEDEVRFLYNSLEDICAAGMELNVPQELIPGYSYFDLRKTGAVLLPTSNCTLTLRGYTEFHSPANETVSASVCPESALRALDYSPQQTMVLDDPYLIIPGNIGVRHRYMEKLVAKWLTRLVDHGIIKALARSADHYERMLDAKRLRLGETVVEDAEPVDSMFEYWVLAVGLAMAGITFVGELVAGGRLRAISWRKSNRV